MCLQLLSVPLCASLRLSARMSLSASSLSLCAPLCVLLFGVSVSLLPFFASFFAFPVCLLLLYARLSVSVSLCVIPASTRSVCMALCVSVRLSACIWCGVSASLHPFFRLLRLYAALCVSLRLSASLFIFLFSALLSPFFLRPLCVCSVPLSASQWRYHVMMMITSFGPEDGAT